MNNYSIGHRIRKLRFKYNLSQEQLAFKAGITTAYLGQIERGEKNPTIKLVEKISNVLELSLSELPSDHKNRYLNLIKCSNKIFITNKKSHDVYFFIMAFYFVIY